MNSGDEFGDAAAQLEGSGLEWLSPAFAAIFALFVRTMNEMFFVGAGFAGPPVNELVTARHVASGLIKMQASAPCESKIITLMPTPTGIVEIDVIGANLSHDNNVSSDLAVVRLDEAQLALHGIELHRLPLVNDRVQVGETVVCVGFPHMADKYDLGPATRAFNVEARPTIVVAEVTAAHDAIENIPAPVFRMEFEMSGGMSGGPIFRPNGDVVGLCSYGPIKGPPWHCFGSMLKPLWEPHSEAEQWLP